MQIKCENCQKGFLIDEKKYEKLPEAIKCPNCSSPIKLGIEKKVEENGILEKELIEKVKEEVLKELLALLPFKFQKDSRLNFSEDKPKALVCEDEQLFYEILKTSLLSLGYEVEVATSSKMALEMVKKEEYAIITVDNRFPDDEEGGFKILSQINSLPPDKRRKMFVAFISADLATMDTNSAFIYGANLTVAKKDIKKIGTILSSGLEEHSKRYKTFFEVLEEVKKSELQVVPQTKL